MLSNQCWVYRRWNRCGTGGEFIEWSGRILRWCLSLLPVVLMDLGLDVTDHVDQTFNRLIQE